jgi:hypothetical protein
MTIRARIAVAVLASASALAYAVDSVQWPPPPRVETRMHELQQVIGSPESSAAEREAAREELSGLLKSPAGQLRGRTPDEKPTRPARAAIDPFPSVVRPSTMVLPPPGGVAHVEVTVPPKSVVNPRSGAILPPLDQGGRFAIDPRTGSVLHEIPGGYLNPRTGQIVPR